ncbi:MAG: rhodanese-like domain-containing protein [Bacteroidota bacterium]
MKTRNLILSILITLSSAGTLFAQNGEPWSSKQIMDPASLALTLNDPKAPKPAIFNIGPIEQIKGAIRIGATRDKTNLDALRAQLSKLPKNKAIVIYCGCCPFQRCPNIRPAFELLNELKFTNAKLLNLSTNLNVDWISKGYPME